MMRPSDLKELAGEIENEHARDRLLRSIDARQGRDPQRYSGMNPCSMCGEPSIIKKGDFCWGCMETVVRAAVAEDRQDHEGHALIVETRSHWNGIPSVDVDSKVPEDACFMRKSYEDKPETSPGSLFAKLATEVAVTALKGFPGMPNGVKPDRVFWRGSFDSDGVTGMAPKGFQKALRDLVQFAVWASNRAYLDGYEKGSSLLAGLAAGTLTNDAMNSAVIREGKRLADKEREALDGKGWRS